MSKNDKWEEMKRRRREGCIGGGVTVKICCHGQSEISTFMFYIVERYLKIIGCFPCNKLYYDNIALLLNCEPNITNRQTERENSYIMSGCKVPQPIAALNVF